MLISAQKHAVKFCFAVCYMCWIFTWRGFAVLFSLMKVWGIVTAISKSWEEAASAFRKRKVFPFVYLFHNDHHSPVTDDLRTSSLHTPDTRGGAERTYRDSRPVASRDAGTWHSTGGTSSGSQDDRAKGHSFNQSSGLMGNFPSILLSSLSQKGSVFYDKPETFLMGYRLNIGFMRMKHIVYKILRSVLCFSRKK